MKKVISLSILEQPENGGKSKIKSGKTVIALENCC